MSKINKLFFAFLFFQVSCNFNHPRSQEPNTTTATLGDAYPRLAAELFNTQCASCHNHGRASGGVNVTTFELLTDPRLIVPGNSAQSLLFTVIKSGTMPQGGPIVSAELQKALACWIDKGAEKAGAGDCFPTEASLGGSDEGNQPDAKNKGDGRTTGGGNGTNTVTSDAYPRLAAELFNPQCLGCHNHSRAAGGVNVTTFELVTDPRLVVPGKSAQSLLFTVIKSGAMPRGGSPAVSAELQKALACWIDKGAVKTGARECFSTGSTGGDQRVDAETGSDDDHGNDEIPEQKSDFDQLMAALFQPSCGECHGATFPSADIELTSYESLMAAGIVKIGDSAASDVYSFIQSGYMPMPPYQVAPIMLAALGCWIDRGAHKEGNAGCFATNLDRNAP